MACNATGDVNQNSRRAGDSFASGCKRLIDADKTVSIRGLYYLTKHTIPGTNEKTFNQQDESDPIIEDVEVALAALREELHVFASSRGTIAGNLTIVSRGDEINLRRMGAGGFGIPGIVEPDVLQFKKCDAKFIGARRKDGAEYYPTIFFWRRTATSKMLLQSSREHPIVD